jgi:hypothetical protein
MATTIFQLFFSLATDGAPRLFDKLNDGGVLGTERGVKASVDNGAVNVVNEFPVLVEIQASIRDHLLCLPLRAPRPRIQHLMEGALLVLVLEFECDCFPNQSGPPFLRHCLASSDHRECRPDTK